MIAVVALVALLANVDAPTDASKSAPPASTSSTPSVSPSSSSPPGSSSSPSTSASSSSTGAPSKPTVVDDADRAAAATTSGVGAFVGATLGGVIMPGAANILGGAVNARPPQKDLVVFATIGGAVGAGIGAGLGSIPTTTPFLGQPVVAAAGAVGALVGLLPSLYFARLTPKTNDPNDPVRLAQSGCLLVAVVAAPAAAAGTAALLAEPGAGR